MNERSTPEAEGSFLPDDMPDHLIELMVKSEEWDLFFPAARVVRVDADNAWFNVGSKFDCPIPLSQWENETAPQVGDKFSVMIDGEFDVDSRPLEILRANVHRVRRMIVWEEIVDKFPVGRICTGEVVRRSRPNGTQREREAHVRSSSAGFRFDVSASRSTIS